MTDEQRERAVVHEAGHAAAAYMVGRRAGIVSIRKSAHYGGLTLHGPAGKLPEGMMDRHFGHPVPLLPAQLRRLVETTIVIALAGDEAAHLYWSESPEPGDLPATTEGEAAAETLALELVRLSRHEREMLDEVERSGQPNDADKAWAVAHAAVSDPVEADAYLEWLRILTRGLIQSPRCLRLIEALVPQLLEHEVLSARAVRAILLRADGKEPRSAPVWAVAADTKRGDEMPEQEVRLRIDPKTPLEELLVCDRAILRSEAGPCAEGVIVTVDDPRVALAPDCFSPLADRIDGLFFPLSERLDG